MHKASDELINEGCDNFRREAIPIHWKLIDRRTGHDIVSQVTKRVAMFEGRDTARQYRLAARQA